MDRAFTMNERRLIAQVDTLHPMIGLWTTLRLIHFIQNHHCIKKYLLTLISHTPSMAYPFLDTRPTTYRSFGSPSIFPQSFIDVQSIITTIIPKHDHVPEPSLFTYIFFILPFLIAILLLLHRYFDFRVSWILSLFLHCRPLGCPPDSDNCTVQRNPPFVL